MSTQCEDICVSASEAASKIRKEDLAVSWWRGRDRGRPAEPKPTEAYSTAHWIIQHAAWLWEMGRAESRCWLTGCLGCCGLCVEMFWLYVSCVSRWAAEPLLWPRVCPVEGKWQHIGYILCVFRVWLWFFYCVTSCFWSFLFIFIILKHHKAQMLQNVGILLLSHWSWRNWQYLIQDVRLLLFLTYTH